MIRKSFWMALALILPLAACQTDEAAPKGDVGTLSSPEQAGKSADRAATETGILLGTAQGNGVGAALNKADRAYAAAAETRAYTAPVGQQVTWRNPQSGHFGTIVPIRDGYANNGAFCREFQQTVVNGGQQKQGYTRACQQPDGAWKLVR